MNVLCAVFGHKWHWRFAIRSRMCERCGWIDGGFAAA